MSEFTLTGELRKHAGKGYARAFRRDGKIPGIFYIHGKDSIPFTVEAKLVAAMLTEKPVLISFKLDDDIKHDAIIREIQRDPVSLAIQHIDLLGVESGVKFTVTVPIHLTGSPAGVKTGGILEHVTRELEIECLPKDLPQHLEYDTTNLEIGHPLHARDLHFENIRILTPEDVVIANIVLPKAVISVEAAEAEAVEAEEEKAEAEAKEKEATQE